MPCMKIDKPQVVYRISKVDVMIAEHKVQSNFKHVTTVLEQYLLYDLESGSDITQFIIGRRVWE